MANNKKFDDFKYIKDKYDERLAQICRSLFPTILEKPGVLSKILESTFAHSGSISKDYDNDSSFAQDFKNIVYAKFHKLYNSNTNKSTSQKTAEELFEEAGYILYPECQTEDEIQSFKKYYREKEALCTFHGGRLKTCRVWFAVKKDVDKIKRENFKNPQRQDEYGTSVLSIQFTRDKNSILSIKNRYNHTVDNPDATFSNDLDNIIPGLTDSMTDEYKINLLNKQTHDFRHYVLANDDKYYRFNHEINNIYYCENNVVIDKFTPKQLDKSRYVLCDYFIIDRQSKTVELYDKIIRDDFVNHFGNIKNIQLTEDKKTKNKNIVIKGSSGEDINLTINEKGKIISYNDPNLQTCGEDFLFNNEALKELNLPNLQACGNSFLYDNEALTKLDLPKLQTCGDYFLFNNKALTEINLPNLQTCGEDFLFNNEALTKLDLPKLQTCGDYFLTYNEALKELNLPNLRECGNSFLFANKALTEINLPNLQTCGEDFLFGNEALTEINLHKLKNESIINMLYINNPNLQEQK